MSVQYMYVDEYGNPVEGEGEGEGEVQYAYVDEYGNPVEGEGEVQYAYVDEYGNPVSSIGEGEVQYAYVDEYGNPIEGYTGEGEVQYAYVDEYGNPIDNPSDIPTQTETPPPTGLPPPNSELPPPTGLPPPTTTLPPPEKKPNPTKNVPPPTGSQPPTGLPPPEKKSGPKNVPPPKKNPKNNIPSKTPEKKNPTKNVPPPTGLPPPQTSQSPPETGLPPPPTGLPPPSTETGTETNGEEVAIIKIQRNVRTFIVRRKYSGKRKSIIVIQAFIRRRLAIRQRKELYEKNKWKLVSEKGSSLDVGLGKTKIVRAKSKKKAPTRGHHKTVVTTEITEENYDPGKGKVLEIPGQGVMMMFDPNAVKLKKREGPPIGEKPKVNEPVNPLSQIKLRSGTTPVKMEQPKQPDNVLPFKTALKKTPTKQTPPPITDLPPPNLNPMSFQQPFNLPPPPSFDAPLPPTPNNNLPPPPLHNMPPPSFNTHNTNNSYNNNTHNNNNIPPPTFNTNMPPPSFNTNIPPPTFNTSLPPPSLSTNKNVPPPLSNNNMPPPINNNMPPPSFNTNMPPPSFNNPPPMNNLPPVNNFPPPMNNFPPPISNNNNIPPPTFNTNMPPPNNNNFPPPINSGNTQNSIVENRRHTVYNAPPLSMSSSNVMQFGTLNSSSLQRLGISQEKEFVIPIIPPSEEIKLDPKSKNNTSKTLNNWLKERPSEQELIEKKILIKKNEGKKLKNSSSSNSQTNITVIKGDKKNRPVKIKTSNVCMNFMCKADLKKKKSGNCSGCGEIFCLDKCLTHKCAIPEFAYKKAVPVCDKCFFKYK